jgi:hypothetical protein
MSIFQPSSADPQRNLLVGALEAQGKPSPVVMELYDQIPPDQKQKLLADVISGKAFTNFNA